MNIIAAVIILVTEKTQREIWFNYVDETKFIELAQQEGMDYIVDIPRPTSSLMSKSDHVLSELCDFIETYTMLILSILGSCIEIWLFYRNKLKIPIKELEQASRNIGENNLDFQITYENKDEMGCLCHEFGGMRKQLLHNNQKLWKNIEEEKMLRAAIAHDIRSPLSVLKGYQEMLMEYLLDETINIDKAIEIASREHEAD